jgi:hypothetical protein
MRYPGEEFSLPDHLYSKEWMDKVVPIELQTAFKEVKNASTSG